MQLITDELPASCSSLAINMVGVVCYLVLILVTLNCFPHINALLFTVLAMLVTVFPIITLEIVLLKSYKHIQMVKQVPDKERVRVKTSGLYGTIICIAFLYLIFPEYHKSYYSLYCAFAVFTGMLVFIVGFIYIEICEQWFPEKEDGLWQAGLLFSGRFSEINKTILAEHIRAWLIKAFFLPLIFSELAVRYDYFFAGKLYLSGFASDNGSDLYQYLSFGNVDTIQEAISRGIILYTVFLLTVEMLFATIGYFFTFKWIRADIKSTDTTWLGWIICLICYPPFIALLQSSYIHFPTAVEWQYWLKNYSYLFIPYGIIFVVLQTLYTLTPVNMGLRFSNLTYRGIVTSGLYRYTKHPMYITKCLGWFVGCMPFLSVDGWLSALYNSFAFIPLGLVYYFRARTEENHLSHYPEYVAYANWINQHGIFHFIGKRLPYFYYNEKRAIAANSSVWWEKIA